MFYEFKPVQSQLQQSEQGVEKKPSTFHTENDVSLYQPQWTFSSDSTWTALSPGTETFQPLCWGPRSHEGLASAASFQRQQRLTDKAMQMDGNAQAQRHLSHSINRYPSNLFSHTTRTTWQHAAVPVSIPTLQFIYPWGWGLPGNPHAAAPESEEVLQHSHSSAEEAELGRNFSVTSIFSFL